MSTETIIKVGGITKEVVIKKKGPPISIISGGEDWIGGGSSNIGGETYIGGEDFIARDIKGL